MRLCSAVPPGMSFPSVFCSSSVLVCTRVYSVCIRLYRLGCRFPTSICTPFVFVCTLTPFGEYNTIGRQEEYKSTKACKRAPSIVLGARWPNGIIAARAIAAAPVRPTSRGKGARLPVCVSLLKRSVFYFPALVHWSVPSVRLEQECSKRPTLARPSVECMVFIAKCIKYSPSTVIRNSLASLFPVHGRRWEIRLYSSVLLGMSLPSGF